MVESDFLSFEDQTVVFIDILGFRRLIEQAARAPAGEVSSRVAQALAIIRNLKNHSGSGRLEAKLFEFEGVLDIRIFSDSVMFSLSGTDKAIAYTLLRVLGNVCFRLMCLGIWVRGGIAYGAASTFDDTIAGPAVNEAYRMESTIADEPRIVLSRSFLEFIKSSPSSVDTLIRRDEDGVYSLDSIEFCVKNHPDQGLFTLQGDGKSIQKHLNRALNEIVDNPNHYRKVSKLAERWNAIADPKRGFFGESDYRTENHVDFVDSINEALGGSPIISGRADW